MWLSLTVNPLGGDIKRKKRSSETTLQNGQSSLFRTRRRYKNTAQTSEVFLVIALILLHVHLICSGRSLHRP